MASFPTTVKSFTAKTDGVDYPQAEHVNSLQDEVSAIETEIGTTAAGGTNLLKRIANLTEDTAPDLTADYIATYDTSGTTAKKILLRRAAGYSLQVATYNNTPLDATTYFFGGLFAATMGTTGGPRRVYFPRAGTIKQIYLVFTSVTGSNETSTVSFRLNDTTDTTIVSTVNLSASPYIASNTSMSVAVAAGDFGEIKWVTPTWATNPTQVSISGLIWVE